METRSYDIGAFSSFHDDISPGHVFDNSCKIFHAQRHGEKEIRHVAKVMPEIDAREKSLARIPAGQTDSSIDVLVIFGMDIPLISRARIPSE